MSIKNLLKDLAALSEEEKALLASALAPKKVPKLKNPPAPPRAERVFFFRQLERLGTISIERSGDEVKKKADQLPPRVIAVNEAQASKLYWKTRGKYEYLGQSDGRTWKAEREAGKSVSEATASEYEACLTGKNLEPPQNREKTFFQGKSAAAASRGIEMDWKEGLKQVR